MNDRHYYCRRQQPREPPADNWAALLPLVGVLVVGWILMQIWPFLLAVVVLIIIGAVAKSAKKGG
jgi:hypothetical protein